jgi:outer membrane protein OmpA-like peptidoglycan-associated protein
MDLNYNDFIYGGLGYRTEVGLIGRVGVNIRKLFFIGYSYEIPMQNIASYGSGSHEIALGLKFCKKQDEVIEPLVSDERLAETPVDTVTIVETIHDTLVVERVDTVFITPKAVSDAEVKKAIFNAEESLEFEYDKAIIRKESFGDLEALTNMLLVREDLTISMEGHTDSRGTAEYNMRLSKDRVEAVKKFLVANGVDASRIKTSYYGETRPIADNETEEGQRKNRRVEMKIIEK